MVFSALVLSLVMPAFAQQPASSTPTADDVARRALDAQAGPAWEKARYFAFTFNVDREGKIAASFPQQWDRYTGDYHVTGKDQKGDAFVITMNVKTMKGKAWKNGVEATAAELPDMMLFGYRRFINDTYWLLMPLKMMDPGVHRTLDGERSDACGRKWDVVKLSFDQGVGLTPGDVYWAWVNRDTGIVEQWDMKLQGTKPEDAPVAVKFHEFRRIGNVLISTAREVVGKKQTVRLDDLVISSDVPKDVFPK
ncbi:MAG: hypothetical protein QOI24_3178 [Acidobacteriota bacterium]|nr:hypothetical protein [Acidobacteriota bacterium]